jgi:NAD(P)-dependent dehydrogenase (short-subunit alcohol dehydrogenase family)
LARKELVVSTPRPLAVVTGGRRGIGAGIVLTLAERGFNVAVTDVDQEGSEEVLVAARSKGALAEFFLSDLGRVEAHAEVVRAIQSWAGPIACLINNAGVPAQSRGDLLQITPQMFDQVMDVNLRGTFFFTQAVVKHMLETEAGFERSIVTVSSVSAEMASIERAEYCLSKAGLGMLTRLLALRLAPHRIGVFEVRPGVIQTPMTGPVSSKYDQRIADGLVPMGRWGFPADVAKAVAALAEGQMGFCTGSVVNVDGGLSIPKL